MSPPLPVIRTFWHGPRLNLWSEICLRSFARQGHDVVVHSYADLALPEGVRREDARAVLPESEVFVYRGGPGRGSISAFTNYFRYALLYRFGGYWVDADMLCQKPFPAFDHATVGQENDSVFGSAVIFARPADPLLGAAMEEARRLGKDIAWGEAGPLLLTRLVRSERFAVNRLEPGAFYPIAFDRVIETLLFARRNAEAERLCGDSYGIHLFNEMFRRVGIDTDAVPPPGSFLERRLRPLLQEGCHRQETERSVRLKLFRAALASRLTPFRPRRARALLIAAIRRSGLLPASR